MRKSFSSTLAGVLKGFSCCLERLFRREPVSASILRTKLHIRLLETSRGATFRNNHARVDFSTELQNAEVSITY